MNPARFQSQTIIALHFQLCSRSSLGNSLRTFLGRVTRWLPTLLHFVLEDGPLYAIVSYV